MAKSRRKSKRRKRLKAKSIRSSNTANFFSFVAGMVSSLMLISIAYAGFRPNDVDESNKPASIKVEGDVVLGITDFEKVIANRNADDAAKLLITLNNWPKNSSLPIKFDYQTKRIAIADLLLDLDCNEDQRILAVESKIEASSAFYALDYVLKLDLPAAARQLREASTPYVDDQNELIRRAALLGVAKLEVFEYAKDLTSQKFEAARDSLFDLTDRLGNDSFVIDNVRLLLRRLILEDVDVGRKMVNAFVARYRDDESAIVLEFSRELHDMLLIADTKYGAIFENRWANGAAGRQALLDTTLSLVRNPDAGFTLINKIGTTLAWFEQIDDFENATNICEALIENAAQYHVVGVGNLAKRYGESGLKRIDLIGKKLELKGETSDGPLNVENYENRVTLIVFFGDDAKSTKTVNQLIKLQAQTRARGTKMLVIATAESQRRMLEKPVEIDPSCSYMLVDDSDPPTNPILEQIPITQVPYIVLLDHESKVAKISVKVSDIRTHINELLNARRRESSSQN